MIFSEVILTAVHWADLSLIGLFCCSLSIKISFISPCKFNISNNKEINFVTPSKNLFTPGHFMWLLSECVSWLYFNYMHLHKCFVLVLNAPETTARSGLIDQICFCLRLSSARFKCLYSHFVQNASQTILWSGLIDWICVCFKCVLDYLLSWFEWTDLYLFQIWSAGC